MFNYRVYDERYIIPAPLPDPDKSYLFANTVAIVMSSAVVISIIVSIIAVAQSIAAERKRIDELALLRAKQSIQEKELAEASESGRESSKGSVVSRSIISPEILNQPHLQMRGISVLFDPDTEEGLKEKDLNPTNVDEFFQQK